MNILFIQHLRFLGGTADYMRTACLEPLGLEYIAAAAESRGHKVRVESGCITVERLGVLLNQTRPDVVGFSVYSYAFPDCIELARKVKAYSQEHGRRVVTVFGGHHPTACPDETAADPAVDYVVVGEGEETFCELLARIERQVPPTDVPGLVYCDKVGLVKTPHRLRIQDVDSLPCPKRSAAILMKAKQHQINYPPPSRQRAVAQVSHSRGCPFSCIYCASVKTWGREVVWRNPGSVCDEIERLVSQFGTNSIYFADLTFNAVKSRVLDFCRTFQKRRIPVCWGGFFRLDLLDEELLEALAAANCTKLSMGIESPDAQYAGMLKGQYHLGQGRARAILKRANELGLILKGYVIIGFPEDTHERLNAYPRHLLDMGLDDIRVSFATPFPGTLFHSDSNRAGLLPRAVDWGDYSTETPIILHPTLSNEQLITLQNHIVETFYLSKEYADHAVKKISRFPHLQESWVEYFRFMFENNPRFRQVPEFCKLTERLVNSGLMAKQRPGPQHSVVAKCDTSSWPTLSQAPYIDACK